MALRVMDGIEVRSCRWLWSVRSRIRRCGGYVLRDDEWRSHVLYSAVFTCTMTRHTFVLPLLATQRCSSAACVFARRLQELVMLEACGAAE
jgi:hypothetical protein